MHGLGNDFAVVDALTQAHQLTPATIAQLADRHRGVGFDQLLLIEAPTDGESDFFYRVYNADGSSAEQCGNGARCVAEFVARKGLNAKSTLRWQTLGAPMQTERDNNCVSVQLPPPDFSARAVGLIGALPSGVHTVSMGNPHAVIAVDDLANHDIASAAQRLRASGVFKHGVNVGFVKTHARNAIDLRVDERGVGETQACGSGACAAVAVGIAAGELDHAVAVRLRGGTLEVYWRGAGHPLTLRGSATLVYDAETDLA